MARSKKVDAIQVISNEDNSIREVGIYDLTRTAYLEFGSYINNWRQLPQIIDGLKISYRRLLYSSLQYPQGKLIKSANLLGKLMEIHPHNTDGCYGIICSYVKTGILRGQGFFGCRSIDGTSSPAAAPRYTESCVSDKYNKLLGRLIKKVPYVESPLGTLEPTYIPTALPMSLFCSDSSISGLGLGISTDLPNFSAKSMYQAYIHDDPSLLEPNIDIDLDKGKSDLLGLWNEGRGRVVYKYRWSRIKGPDGNPGMLIEGDAGIFVPRLKRIKDWQADGKVYIEDMVTQDGAKLAIYKVPNVKSITIDDIENEVEKICVNNNTYSLNVSDGGSAFRIPLREWIKATYTNYINLVTQE